MEQAVQVASAWYLGHLRIRKALAALPAERSLTVRAEALLGMPWTMPRRIFQWLELEAGDDVVEHAMHTDRCCFVGTGANQGLFGGDHKFMHAPQLRRVPPPGPLRFPEEWLVPKAMCAKMTELAVELGYRVDGAGQDADR